MNVYLENIFRFAIVLLIQVFVLNNIYLHGFVVPVLYLYFVIKLPFDLQKTYVLLLAFLMGIVVDVCIGTPGINAAATVAVAFFRPFFIKIVLPAMSKDSVVAPSITGMGFLNFTGYSSLLVIVHSFLLVILETFSFQDFRQTLLRFLACAAVSFLIIIVSEMFVRLFHREK